MSWRDRYRPGSFRGVPFVTRAHDADFGRRGETNQFPGRDEPYREDLGRAARRWTITAFVIGADYMTERDALVAAIEAPGPGTLVHPFLGSFRASVDACHLAESTDEGGMARFDLVFVEPGALLPPSIAPDTGRQLLDQANATDATATDRFAASFAAVGEPGFVVDKAETAVATIVAAAVVAGRPLVGSGSTLRAFQAGLALLDDGAALVGDPEGLASSIGGLIGALAGLGSRPATQVAAIGAVIHAATTLPAIAATTPSRAQEAANQQALADLVVVAAAGAMARVAEAADFGSYDEAVALRDAVADALDDQGVAAADRGDDAMAADLDALRRAVVADVTARGGSLARLFTYTPVTVSPALVVAWRLYRQPAELIDQAADLVARNGVRHPGFVPAAPIAVLTAGAAGAR